MNITQLSQSLRDNPTTENTAAAADALEVLHSALRTAVKTLQELQENATSEHYDAWCGDLAASTLNEISEVIAD